MGDEEVCLSFNGEVENEKAHSSAELKRNLDCVVNDPQEDASPCKKIAKDPANDDVSSEVTDSIISPRDNVNAANSQLKNDDSKAGDAGTCVNNHQLINYGEITSSSSGNTMSTEFSSDEDSRINCNHSNASGGGHSGESISHVILEIPKHASSSGIRKITFKFSNKKKEEEHISRLSKLEEEAQQPLPNEGESGFVFRENELGLDDATTHSSKNVTELKMSKKVSFDSYPTTVKKLLSTGILEGAQVKYVTTSRDKEIPGIVQGCGYLCGCSICNYKNVLSAYEFEKHAGGAKTRHPNNHIHLENGRPIYSIIEELKTSPLGLLENVVKAIAGSSFNEYSFHEWKASLGHHDGWISGHNNNQVEPLISSQHHLSSTSKDANNNPCLKPKIYVCRNGEQSKRVVKRPVKLAAPQKKSGEGGNRKRDNDLHRLLFMPNGLPDGAELDYYAKGQRILRGVKQGNGILCSHCNREISPSQFEAHAGWAARRQPYRHIYTSNGLTLHDIAVSLANGQSLTTGHSDDMCTVCGDGGQLTLCHRCPRAYHAACLGSEIVASDDWCCPDCVSKATSGDPSGSNARPIIIRLTRVVKEQEPESGGCSICRAQDFSSGAFDDRTVIICDQCEKEFHVSCLRDNGCCDLKELPDGDWFCCEDCSKIHAALWDQFSKDPEMIPPLVMRMLQRKGLNCVSENDVQWVVIKGSKSRSEHLPLLSKAAAIFREQFNPIVSASGRDLIPVMVHGRNICGQEFGGMYTVLLLIRSTVVSAGLLRVFGQEVAELPLVATSKGNTKKGYFQALFACIERLLSSLNVENLVLPASEEAKTIWTHKFGFKTMTQEQFSKYRRSYQLTAFSGTTWLAKAVACSIDNE